MQLIVPDVLAEAKGLSTGGAGLLFIVGFLLWTVGWRWHRFWVVFGITLAAGIMGLTAGKSAGGHQVLVVGVLMAVAAGMLALELAKILSFVTGGMSAWVAAQAIFPQAQELWAVFLSGGLIGVVLYRLWTMLATSFLGTLIAGHAGFVLAEIFFKFNAAKWAAEHTAALNGAVMVLMLIGVIVQTRTAEAYPAPKAEVPEEKGKKSKKKPKDDDEDEDDDHKEGGGAGWKKWLPMSRAA